MTKMIREKQGDYIEFEGTLKVIKDKILFLIEKYGVDAIIEQELGYDNYTENVLYTVRPETPEEENRRVKQEKRDEEFRKQRNYATYLQLKKVFENAGS